MTNEEKEAKLSKLAECPICLHWIALCMVEPRRGHPSKINLQERDVSQILERIRYWKDNSEDLMKHGIEYDPSTEKIGRYEWMDK